LSCTTEEKPSPEAALQTAYSKRAEGLHNAMVELLVKEKADVYTILFVLEMIRYEVVSQKYKELMG
jgi:hypothetical protein